MTIFVVTHELHSAFRIADRLALLYNRSLIAVDTKEKFSQDPNPPVRRSLDRQPEKAPGGVAEAFIEFYLRGSRHDH